MIHYILIIIFLAILVKGWRTTRKKVDGMPLPPGPRLLPFVGNVLDIDLAQPSLTYAKWGKQYGDIVYTRLFGQHFIIINSEHVAKSLVAKRSTIYSERPVIPTNEYFGLSFNTGLLPYGDTFRTHRKLYHQVLRIDAASSYQDLYLRKAHELVLNLLDAPMHVQNHLNTLASSLIISVMYGYDAKQRDDPFLSSVQKLTRIITQVITPERAALEMFFPFLVRIPSFIPGGRFKKQALECRSLVQDVLEKPFEYVKKQLAQGVARPSLVSDFLTQGDEDERRAHEQLMKEVAATAYMGGSETTSATLHVFLLAMLLYPQVQARARVEIDTVCGRDRIPTFRDRNSLPYIEAICREVFRWKPVVPLGLPHATSCDDVYNGYLIPKGTVVLLNAWGMGHDKDIYPNPSDFDPGHHFTADGELKDEPTYNHFSFGFGRRICPGRFFADNSLWACIVSILSTIEVAKGRDEDGNDIDFKPEFTSGLGVRPKEFPCSMWSVSSVREEQMRTLWKDVNRVHFAAFTMSAFRRALHTSIIRKTDRPTLFTNMLAGDVPPPVQVSSITSAGIQLANGLILPSACIFLDGKVFLWDVPAHLWDGWGRRHWGVFEAVAPKPEILVFGTGRRMELPPPSIRGYLKEMGIQLDIMDTRNACSTYNLLAEEGRRVAAALLPYTPRPWRS